MHYCQDYLILHSCLAFELHPLHLVLSLYTHPVGMAEATCLKDLSAKIETVLTVLDQKEEKDRIREERIIVIEKSLASTSKFIENIQLRSSPSEGVSSTQTTSILSAPSNHRSGIPNLLRFVKMDFPRFNGSEPLHWIFHAE